MGLGTVTIPGDGQPKVQERPAETRTPRPPEAAEVAEPQAAQQNPSAAEKNAEKIEPVVVKQTVYSSVLDRFRTYQGEKSPEVLVALFSTALSPYIRQEPGVAVSDGTAVVRVTIDLRASKGEAINFALSGAKMVSLKMGDEAGLWVLEALPLANSLKATVTIMNSSSVIEYPLTVVPPVAAVSAKREDFALFLKDNVANAPRYDLNGDGRHDYLDDFIYTAHYLITRGGASKKAR
jgi:hypothetical protein